MQKKQWLHQACSNRGNIVTMVSPVAIPKVVTRLLKTLSKQGGIKIKHDQSWWKAGPFFLDHSLSFIHNKTNRKHADLRVAKSHFDMQQTSTGCATKQQRRSSEWTRTEAFSPVVMCRALWGMFIQPEQKTQLWRLSATCKTFLPCCRGLRSPADWQWTAGKNSSGSSGCHPPPHLYRSTPSSSGRWDPHWGTNGCSDITSQMRKK